MNNSKFYTMVKLVKGKVRCPERIVDPTLVDPRDGVSRNAENLELSGWRPLLQEILYLLL